MMTSLSSVSRCELCPVGRLVTSVSLYAFCVVTLWHNPPPLLCCVFPCEPHTHWWTCTQLDMNKHQQQKHHITSISPHAPCCAQHDLRTLLCPATLTNQTPTCMPRTLSMSLNAACQQHCQCQSHCRTREALRSRSQGVAGIDPRGLLLLLGVGVGVGVVLMHLGPRNPCCWLWHAHARCGPAAASAFGVCLCCCLLCA